MNMSVLSIAEYVALAVGLGAGIVLGIEKWKARNRGLRPNPTRCQDHKERITNLEKGYGEVCVSLGRLEEGMKGLTGKVDTLLSMHLKP